MIREANEFDSLNISKLLHTYSDNKHINDAYIKQDILNNNYSNYYLYEQNGEVIGMINFHKMGDYAEIIDIVVLEKYRNQKIGTKLLQYSINILNECKITLEVRESNKAAIGLYEKLGFKIIGMREKYYKNENAYIMKKEVGDNHE